MEGKLRLGFDRGICPLGSTAITHKRDLSVEAKTAQRACLRRNHLRRKHGLTEDDYERVLTSQLGVCARCRSSDPGNGRQHFTIWRRGVVITSFTLLCARCVMSEKQTKRSPYIRTDAGPIAKVCSKCGKTLPLTEYYQTRNSHLTGACKACLADYGMDLRLRDANKLHQRKGALRKYGLTLDQYNALLSSQDGKCAICGSTNSGRMSDKHFCVDHDHQTGQIRGLLCHCCNLAVGHFKDQAILCRMAAAYLEHVIN